MSAQAKPISEVVKDFDGRLVQGSFRGDGQAIDLDAIVAELELR